MITAMVASMMAQIYIVCIVIPLGGSFGILCGLFLRRWGIEGFPGPGSQRQDLSFLARCGIFADMSLGMAGWMVGLVLAGLMTSWYPWIVAYHRIIGWGDLSYLSLFL